MYPKAWLNGAVWLKEFQEKNVWTCQGEIKDKEWDNFPEHLDGDFSSYKDINHGQAPRDSNILKDSHSLESRKKRIDGFQALLSLFNLVEIYKFWIAYADIDGFRVDTVKHIKPGVMRIFVKAIHEFAQSLGKENFYIISEVTGGRTFAIDMPILQASTQPLASMITRASLSF